MLKRLHHRLVVASIAMVMSVCTIFSLGLYFAFDLAEDLLFDTHLAADVASYIAIYEKHPSAIDLPRENFLVYAVRNGDTAHLPDHISALRPDEDDLVFGGREYHVQIEDRGNTRFYFLFDESAFESFEDVLLFSILAIVIGVMASAAWLSVGLANRIIQPLTDLSRQVARLDDSNTSIQLDTDAPPGDEIAMLATAINGYHQRISELLIREREFSSDVSHELRTPLMGIQGAAELIHKRSEGDDAMRELAARVRRGCLQMTTLTEALLYLARDPASFKDMIEPVSVERVVDKQISAVRDVAESKGVSVLVERTGTAAMVDTIPAVIDIVIGNILKNAVKYTDQKIINVFVTPDEVVIQDYGPGIDKTVQSTLFDRFNRGENRNPDGTGIGLALVRRFCDQYGWVIDFRSEETKGTRVAVAF
ncbi:MAG: HAMP domain-containing sensor histidine kinase [Proteobacteria bacterium]|nr:HAMP domain-containing sensor histidine kinase [Pseudomonadota bacterium]